MTYAYVLAHKDNSFTAEDLADLLHVVRTNVGALDDQNLGVLIQEVAQLSEVFLLSLKLGVAFARVCHYSSIKD
jgi:hypothetical protein